MPRDLVSKEVWDRDAMETMKRPPLIHTEIIEQIVTQAAPGSLVLEIGAQRGVDAARLTEKGYRVVALDYSQESILMMKSSFRDNLMIVSGDIRYLPFRSNSFDLVYSQGLLEHFFEPDLGTIMLEQKRVVSDRGFVLIDV